MLGLLLLELVCIGKLYLLFCTFYFSKSDKGKYKDLGLQHNLDMWHGAKNLAKRIHAVSSAVIIMALFSA